MAPWVRFYKLRKEKGLTQAQLAAGIVSQSMLSHVERGRILPSEATLASLAERLEVPTELLLAWWEPWRKRQRARFGLWDGAQKKDALILAKILQDATQLLMPFEVGVFTALFNALSEEYEMAELWLDSAWESEMTPQADLSQRGPSARQSRGAAPEDAPWSKADKARAFVVDAMARIEIFHGTGRSYAADCWSAKLRLRSGMVQ